MELRGWGWEVTGTRIGDGGGEKWEGGGGERRGLPGAHEIWGVRWESHRVEGGG